jgi:hypothetical protein
VLCCEPASLRACGELREAQNFSVSRSRPVESWLLVTDETLADFRLAGNMTRREWRMGKWQILKDSQTLVKYSLDGFSQRRTTLLRRVVERY